MNELIGMKVEQWRKDLKGLKGAVTEMLREEDYVELKPPLKTGVVVFAGIGRPLGNVSRSARDEITIALLMPDGTFDCNNQLRHFRKKCK